MIKTAVILAAGLGSRLKDRTKNMPKGFLEINGKSLIEESIKKLISAGIEEVIIGTGYLPEFFEGLKTKYNCVKCVLNPKYAETGSACTLYNMKDFIQSDFLLLESDLIYEKRALDILISSSKKDIVLASGETGSNDEVYISFDSDFNLMNMSKKREVLPSIDAELVGISKISIDTYKKMVAFAEKEFVNNPKLDYEYNLVGVSNETPVYIEKIDDLLWCEIDDEQHLKRAVEKIIPKIEIKEKLNLKRNILLNPGPATTTDTVKMSLVTSDICPREKEFENIMRAIRFDLTKIAGGDGDYTTILFCGSGTAVMDATINSVVPHSTKIAIIINGAYGDRLVKIAKAYNIDCVELRYDYGSKIDLDEIDKKIGEDKNISTVAMIHHETTTGILNPIKEIGAIVKKHNKVFIVDTISSFAGVPVDIKECKIDFMMSTSNKCIQAMAGVAFVICKINELNKIRDYKKRSFYLDLYSQYDYMEKTGQTQFTPPVQIIYSLRKAIDEFLEEGYSRRYKRYSENWKVLRKGLLDMGFELLHSEEEESHILLTILDPTDKNYDFYKMHDFLYERGFTIYPGKVGKINSFRLANMGDIYPYDIREFLITLKEYLSVFKIKLQKN